MKRKHTEEVGGSFEVVDLSAAGAYADVENRVKAFCARPDVHGVILVMSSQPEVDEIELTNLIPANKDVDGLSAANLGALVQNDPRKNSWPPPRRGPVRSRRIADRIEGKRRRCDRQGTHGRKAARKHADQRRRDGHRLSLREQGYSANRAIGGNRLRRDGRPHHFGQEYFRDGQVIIDAGIGFIDGKLAGDVDIASLGTSTWG